MYGQYIRTYVLYSTSLVYRTQVELCRLHHVLPRTFFPAHKATKRFVLADFGLASWTGDEKSEILLPALRA